jgi:hypothetical protein
MKEEPGDAVQELNSFRRIGKQEPVLLPFCVEPSDFIVQSVVERPKRRIKYPQVLILNLFSPLVSANYPHLAAKSNGRDEPRRSGSRSRRRFHRVVRLRGRRCGPEVDLAQYRNEREATARSACKCQRETDRTRAANLRVANVRSEDRFHSFVLLRGAKANAG